MNSHQNRRLTVASALVALTIPLVGMPAAVAAAPADPAAAVGATRSPVLLAAGAPIITSPAPLAVLVASSYYHRFTASGSPAPTWSVTAGALPAGLSLDPVTGVLSGRPAAVLGIHTFTVTASNTAGSASQGVVLVGALGGGGGTGGSTGAASAPGITSQPPGDAVVGQAYRHAFTAVGNPAPTWSLVDGELPAGLVLDPTTGVLSGTPTQVGVRVFTVRATNGSGQQDQRVTLSTVAAASVPQVSSAVPAAGTTGLPYAHRFTASGTPSPTWSVTSGALPAGLTLDPANGLLGGTPTAAGSSTFTVTATNSAGRADQAVTVRIASAGDVPVLSVPDDVVVGVVGEALSTRVSATGAPAPTYAVEGVLPAGLVLDPATGLISGTPTGSGSSRVVVTATNAAGTGRLPLRFDVAAAGAAVDPAAGTVRWDGADRVATAVAVSQSLFTRSSARSVVVTTSQTYADAIGGGRLAAAAGGPLLLTSPAALDTGVATEIRRVLPAGGTIFVLGGEAALSPAVEDSLRTLGGHVVERLAGADRFETATATADRVVAATGASSPATVYLANGLNFPDGLAVSALASRTGGVVLLTDGAALPAPTRAYLARHDPEGDDTVPVGGPAANAARSLPAAAARAAVANSVVGADRYDTAARIAATFTTGRAASAGSVDAVGLATGLNWPDALVGAAALGHLRGPLLLTPPDALHPTVSGAVAELHGESPVRTGIVFGGEAALAGTVHEEFATLVPGDADR